MPSNNSPIVGALLTAAAFIALLVVVVLIARFKKIPLPIAPPGLGAISTWLLVFIVAAIGQESLGSLTGGPAAQSWDALTPARLIRAATIVLLAPVAEEVAFRGTMYGNLMKKGMHPAVAILLPAAAFALMHLQYFGPGLLFIFVDGIIFGLARHRTQSLFVPILLHVLGNAYAVAERIAG
jgi:membrane protease YdiL (CAAX protease family)